MAFWAFLPTRLTRVHLARRLLPLVAVAALIAACSPERADESIRSQSATTIYAGAAADGELGDRPPDPASPETVSPEPVPPDPPLGASRDDPAPLLSTDPDAVFGPGTCYEPPAPTEQAVEVPCTEPHTIEVYAHRELDGGPGALYQGLDEAVALCDEDFARITGVGLGLATVYDRSVLRPSEETWADGERDVTCYVVYPEPVTTSLAAIDPVRAFGLVSIYGLQVGDCLLDFDGSVTTFEVLSCDDPHDHEVFVAAELPPGPYPGEAAIEAQAAELCYGDAFEEFVGVPAARSAITAVPSRPWPETWAMGDRTINCLLTDDLIRIGSLADSGA